MGIDNDELRADRDNIMGEARSADSLNFLLECLDALDSIAEDLGENVMTYDLGSIPDFSSRRPQTEQRVYFWDDTHMIIRYDDMWSIEPRPDVTEPECYNRDRASTIRQLQLARSGSNVAGIMKEFDERNRGSSDYDTPIELNEMPWALQNLLADEDRFIEAVHVDGIAVRCYEGEWFSEDIRDIWLSEFSVENEEDLPEDDKDTYEIRVAALKAAQKECSWIIPPARGLELLMGN